MASNPDAFLSALIGTTGLRPIQDVQAGQQALAQGQQQLQIGQMQIGAAQQAAQRQAAFTQDTQHYFANPSPANLAALVQKYPEQAEQLQKTYSILDAPVRQGRIQQLGSLYYAAKNNRPELVGSTLRTIIEAEKAQGIDTSDAEDALAAVNAGDKNALNYVQAFAQAHLAAADKDFAKAIGVGSEAYTLSQGQQRYDGNNNLVASVAPKPDYLVVPEGGTAFPLNGAPALNSEGGDPATAAPVNGGDIIARMLPITLGAEGGGTLANPKVSPKGARGPMQVMPGTNANPGFGVRAAQDDSEAERARVGRDYLGAMMQRYGDPAKAWAAYNAGPGAVDSAVASGGSRWLQSLPAETRKYVARNMAQLQSGGPTGSSVTVRPSGGAYAGSNGVLHGAPKRGWSMMTPAEVQTAGLDPSLAYQRGPDGQVQPVGGQKQQFRTLTPQEASAAGLSPDVKYQVGPDGKIEAIPGQRSAQLKPIPQAGVKAITENNSTIRQIESALTALQRRPQSIGPGTGMLGDTFTQYNDPEGTATRAALGKIAGQIIHDVSGAAVTLSEEPRFKPYVPLVTDRPSVAVEKLRQLLTLARGMQGDLNNFYSEAQGYRSIDSGSAALGSSHENPIPIRSPQEAAKHKGQWVRTPDGRVGRVR